MAAAVLAQRFGQTADIAVAACDWRFSRVEVALRRFVRNQGGFQTGDRVFQLQFAFFEPFDRQLVGGDVLVQAIDRHIQVAMLQP